MDRDFIDRVRRVREIAEAQARRLRQTAIRSEDLLYAILQVAPNVATVALNKAADKIKDELAKHSRETSSEPADGAPPDWDASCKRIFDRAATEAAALGHKFIGVEHIFLALLAEQTDKISDLLKKAGVEYSNIRKEVLDRVAADQAADAVELKIKQRDDCKDIPLPSYMSRHASGMDLYAAVPNDVVLETGRIMLVPTGIFVAVPPGYEAQVRPRSGLALKHGLMIVNSPGTIDSDYRGEVGVILANMGGAPFVIQRGMRIAQMVIQSVVQAKLVATDDLDVTDRNDGGFGHTGV